MKKKEAEDNKVMNTKDKQIFNQNLVQELEFELDQSCSITFVKIQCEDNFCKVFIKERDSIDK